MIVVFPEVVRVAGLKAAVTPDGSPVAPNVTEDANPLFIVRLPVRVPRAVGAIDIEVGATESV